MKYRKVIDKNEEGVLYPADPPGVVSDGSRWNWDDEVESWGWQDNEEYRQLMRRLLIELDIAPELWHTVGIEPDLESAAEQHAVDPKES